MKREDIFNSKLTIFTLIISYFTIFVYLGYNIFIGIYKFSENKLLFLEFGLSLLVVFIFSLIFHEFGHFIFGLISKFKVLSFEVLGIKFLRVNKKTKVTRGQMVSVGQCIMGLDKDKMDKVNLNLYMAGGIIMNIILFLLGVGLMILSWFMRAYIAPYATSIAFINLYFLYSNAIPLNQNGLYNDALNIKLQKKYKEYYDLVILSLRMNTIVEEGSYLEDMTELNNLVNSPITEKIPIFVSQKYPIFQYRIITSLLYDDSLFFPKFYANTADNVRYYYPKQMRLINTSTLMLFKILSNEAYEYLFMAKENEPIVKSNRFICAEMAKILRDYNLNNRNSVNADIVLDDIKSQVLSNNGFSKLEKDYYSKLIELSHKYIYDKEHPNIEAKEPLGEMEV